MDGNDSDQKNGPTGKQQMLFPFSPGYFINLSTKNALLLSLCYIQVASMPLSGPI
jgi:hypothetical protein